MSEKIKVGIIGTGGISNCHFTGYKSRNDVDVVACCDIDFEKAKKYAEEKGIPHAYPSYDEMLKNEKLDAVSVTTWNAAHKCATIAALNAGVNVICEKPMAMNAAEAREMAETAKKSGKLLMVGFVRRYGNDAAVVKKFIDAGQLGEIYYAKATYLRRNGCPGRWFGDKEYSGGGPLIDIGTHALDLTLWCMNNYEPKYCVGTTYKKLGHIFPSANCWGDWKPEDFTVEDSAFGFIVMKNGATVSLESSWALNMLDTREACTLLCGTNAGIDMNNGVRINGVRGGKLYELYPALDGKGVDFYDASGEEAPADREARLWIDAVINDKTPVVTPEQAYCVSRILNGIYESAKTGEPYYFD